MIKATQQGAPRLERPLLCVNWYCKWKNPASRFQVVLLDRKGLWMRKRCNNSPSNQGAIEILTVCRKPKILNLPDELELFLLWSWTESRCECAAEDRHRVNDHHYLMFHSSRKMIAYPRTGGQYKGSKASLSRKPQTAAFACTVSISLAKMHRRECLRMCGLREWRPLLL